MSDVHHAPAMSCGDCHVRSCRGNTEVYPAFCPTKNMDEGMRKDAVEALCQGMDHEIAVAAAEVEYEGYGRWCRVEDTIAFARKLKIQRIGIATCVGMLSEAQVLNQILRARGFEVYVVSCKVGAVAKTEIGISPCCSSCGVNLCDPILQAKLLNEKDTQLNIVFGLCVGHDSLFYKYSSAICTTLVAKDRITGHNPVIPLYLTQSYYKRLMEEPVPVNKLELSD